MAMLAMIRSVGLASFMEALAMTHCRGTSDDTFDGGTGSDTITTGTGQTIVIRTGDGGGT